MAMSSSNKKIIGTYLTTIVDRHGGEHHDILVNVYEPGEVVEEVEYASGMEPDSIDEFALLDAAGYREIDELFGEDHGYEEEN